MVIPNRNGGNDPSFHGEGLSERGLVRAAGDFVAAELARWGVIHWVSSKREITGTQVITKATSAIFEASVLRENMLSPKNTPGSSTP